MVGEADGVTSWFLGAADVGADRCVQRVHVTLCCVLYRRVACMCSLGNNGIWNDGAVAIAGALAHVPQLTTLEYVVLVLVLVVAVVVCAWVVGMWRLYGGVGFLHRGCIGARPSTN